MPFLPYLDAGSPTLPRGNPDQFGAPQIRAGEAFAQALGQVAEATRHIADTELESRTRLAAVEAEAELRTAEFEVQDANDPEKAEADFAQRSKAIGAQYGEKLPGKYGTAFEAQFLDVSSQHEASIRGWVRDRRVANTRAATDKTLDGLQNFAADAKTGEEAARYRAQALDAVDASEKSGAFSPEEARVRRENFDRGLDRANIREAIRLNPGGAFESLAAGRFQGIDAEEKQYWLSTAQASYEQDVRQGQAAHDRERILGDKARADAAERIHKDLIDKSVATGITMADLVQYREVATDTEYLAAVKVATSGGHLPKPEGGTDGADYTRLYDLAAEGDPDAPSAIRNATLGGLLTPSEHDKLLGISTDTRFGDARKLISESFPLDPVARGLAAMHNLRTGKLDPVVGAAARRDFEDWALKNKEASRDDARVKADQIVRDYREAEVDREGAALPKPTGMRDRPASQADLDKVSADLRKSVAERMRIPDALVSPDVLKRDPYFRQQAVLIARWREWVAAHPAKKKAGGTP